jgi:hypothetical protein
MREPKDYLVTSRTTGYFTCHSLKEAIDAARVNATEEYVDFAIWRGSEILAIVLAGGEVTPVMAEAWSVVRELDGEGDGYAADPDFEDDPVVDLDALGQPWASEPILWEE